jgi:ATP-dependent Clp protease protease subunit
MLKIVINNQIAPDSEKMAYIMSGEGFPTSYTDIQSLLDYFPEEQEVMLELHSCGGDTTEGWAIYDALRASGRTIHAKVVGECASMATIIFLAAPKERRSIAKHGRMLIHSPYFPDAGAVTRDNIGALQATLEEEHNKMLNEYIARTGTDRETLEAQMSAGGWFDADMAVALGFAGFVAPELSASTQSKKDMKKNKLKAALEAFCAAFASTSAMTFTTKDGMELEVEREEGEIEVGDPASPDGEFILEDGRTVIVKDGVIVDIKDAESEEPAEETPETEAVEEEPTPDEPAEDVEELKKQIEELKKENEDLKKQLEEKEEVVAAVNALGGKKFLAQQTSAQLSVSRKAVAKQKVEEDNPFASILAAKREALKNKKK